MPPPHLLPDGSREVRKVTPTCQNPAAWDKHSCKSGPAPSSKPQCYATGFAAFMAPKMHSQRPIGHEGTQLRNGLCNPRPQSASYCVDDVEHGPVLGVHTSALGVLNLASRGRCPRRGNCPLGQWCRRTLGMGPVSKYLGPSGGRTNFNGIYYLAHHHTQLIHVHYRFPSGDPTNWRP